MNERKAHTLSIAIQSIVFGVLLEIGGRSLEYAKYACIGIFLAVMTALAARGLRQLWRDRTKIQRQIHAAKRRPGIVRQAKRRIAEFSGDLTMMYYNRFHPESRYDGKTKALSLAVVIPAIILYIPLEINEGLVEYAQYALGGIAVTAIGQLAIEQWLLQRNRRQGRKGNPYY